jgi:hypothetical protein
LALTVAFAVGVKRHVFALLPPLEHAPDQMASRPLETVSVIAVPLVKDADPVLPTETLIPAGLEVTRSPLRPEAVTVTLTGAPPPPDACGVKLRTLDHAPAVPAEFLPRTRHQCWTAESDAALNCDVVTVWSTTSGDENALESSICT